MLRSAVDCNSQQPLLEGHNILTGSKNSKEKDPQEKAQPLALCMWHLTSIIKKSLLGIFPLQESTLYGSLLPNQD